MIKKFILIFFISISLISFVGVKANEINNIVIKGNNRISNDTITIFSDIEIGNKIITKS